MAGTTSSRQPSRRQATAAIAALTGVALIAGILLNPFAPSIGASPSPTGTSSADPSGGPSASGLPGGEPGTEPGSQPAGEWAAVDLPAIPAAATLEPSRRDVAGIAPESVFSFTSLTGEPAATLASRLEVTPPIDLVAQPGSGGQVTLKPKAPLTPGGQYRFALKGPGGSLAGSWLFRVRSPIHVINTIPGHEVTGVPLNTGIEVMFDQDGVADMADHFTIRPAVNGRFERHGRTQVFVPVGLKAKTLYSVTIKAGLTRSGTDVRLESDVSFGFETEGPATRDPRFEFGRDIVESPPGEAPLLAASVYMPSLEDGNEAPAPTSIDVTVYRLPSQAVARERLAAFLTAPRWADYTKALMPTDGLAVAARFKAPFAPDGNSAIGQIRFPEPLAPGSYIVEIGGPRKVHALLQVTPVAAWVSVLDDRTVVWVNDVVGGSAIKGATVATGDGKTIGTADASGLAIFKTSAALLPATDGDDPYVVARPRILSVVSPTGGSVLVALDAASDEYRYRGSSYSDSPADPKLWSILATDRSLYRTADRIEVWGYVRGRDTDAVPASVELRLVDAYPAEGLEPPPVAARLVKPDASGAFIGTLDIRSAPLGAYEVQALVGGRLVAARWLQVGVIRKPAYRIELTPKPLAVISGSKVAWTTTATFFDGSLVPGMRFRMNDETNSKPTNAAGRTTVTTTVRAEGYELTNGDPTSSYMSAVSIGGEEGQIETSAEVVVFPTAYHLAADGSVKDGRLQVSGILSRVDLKKVEARIRADTWKGEPAGAPVTGAKIRIVVTELVPVRTKIRDEYDVIDKVVRPVYEYSFAREAVTTVTRTTNGKGRFSGPIAIPDPKHQYEIKLSTKDPKGRAVNRQIQAGIETPLSDDEDDAGLQFSVPMDGDETHLYRVGEQVVWPMTDDGARLPSGGSHRYLYIVAQRGLRSAVVSDSATFRKTFGAADAPGAFVVGVRFTGHAYAREATAWATFDASRRAINVSVKADKKRYRPGEDMKLTIRTTDAAGKPIPASIVVQAVDAKIYALDGASVEDPLGQLYDGVESGIVSLASTHQDPTIGRWGEGGDVGGGGGDERSEFRDTLAFRALRTNGAGTATTTIDLSDDLTSWHVSVGAVTGSLQAGSADLLVPVGLPLFAEATVADEYLAADRPTIRLRAFGEALRTGDRVVFTVTAPSLGVSATRIAGKAFSDASFALPKLSLGSHRIEIAVTAPGRLGPNGRPLTDRLIRIVNVTRSRLTTARASYVGIADPRLDIGSADSVTYTFADAGQARHLAFLFGLADPDSPRYDDRTAASIARGLLVGPLGMDPALLPPLDFERSTYQRDGGGPDDTFDPARAGIALVPHGGTDRWLMARLAMVAPETGGGTSLEEGLAGARALDSIRRDLEIAIIAGLAGLGHPVASDLAAARAQPDLTPMELIHLGMGFHAIGDDASAVRIERDLLKAHGQRLGPWVRLQVGRDAEAAIDATAALAVLAAGLGDPLAPDLVAYVISHPSRQTSHSLELAGSIARMVERTPAAEASFAYRVDGKRTVVTLGLGKTATLTLTAAQQRTLQLERLSGHVGIAAAWRDVADPQKLRLDPALGLTRKVAKSPLPTDRLTTVDLVASFDSSAVTGDCYEVVEKVPSGLAPTSVGWAGDAKVLGPTSISGQTVTFCVPHDKRAGSKVTLRYVARVVNAGTFSWEPAVMQLVDAPEKVALSPATTVRIGR